MDHTDEEEDGSRESCGGTESEGDEGEETEATRGDETESKEEGRATEEDGASIRSC